MVPKISKDAYMDYAFQFTGEERHLQNMFMDWLPDVILDSHAHLLPEVFAPIRLEDFDCTRVASTFPSYSLEESNLVSAAFYPNKKLIRQRFVLPLRGVNFRGANNYIKNLPSSDGLPVLYGLPDDIEYTIREMQSRCYVALKAYSSYIDPPATKIYQYFAPEVLDVAEAMGMPIILHLPSPIDVCKDDLHQVIRDFPRLRVVLAHMGLVREPSTDISAAFDGFAAYSNISMDTSMVISAGVIKSGLDTFGYKRILFGSDEPLCLIRANEYIHPKLGPRLITEYPYHWVNQAEHRLYRHLVDDVTHILWQALSAIKEAVDLLPPELRTRAKENIFFRNAIELFHS